MFRRKLSIATLACAISAAAMGEAGAQANLVPDHTPRMPPQPGQGLPLEDIRFLREAFTLSMAEVKAAAKVEQTGDSETQDFAASLVERHRRLTEEISALARQRHIDFAAPIEGAADRRAAEVQRRLDRLGSGSAADGNSVREFLAAQMDAHTVLVELYQTQASQSADRDLGRFAITTLVALQKDFATAVRLGERHGLPQPDHMLANPPQYGPGAGPSR